jgi:hypothetical protein
MTVKRKKPKNKTKRISFRQSSSKKKQLRKATDRRRSLIFFSIVLAVLCVLAAVGIGFVFLDRYVKKAVPVSEKTGVLKLLDTPAWVNSRLEEKVYEAAMANGEDLKLDEDAAMSVQQNIEAQVAWLDEVKVQITNDSILIKGRWRKPLALVKSGLRKFYKNDVSEKPLLYEIDSIDVSNFNGRQNSSFPHIVLYAKDDTEIIWGAEIGAWQRYLEATDEEKLAKLYSHYEEYGSLLNNVKYINLRDPQDSILLPVDRY